MFNDSQVKWLVGSILRNETSRDGLVWSRPGIGLIKGMTIDRCSVARPVSLSVDEQLSFRCCCIRITSHYRCASKSLLSRSWDSTFWFIVRRESQRVITTTEFWLIGGASSLPIQFILLRLLFLFLFQYRLWPTFSIRFGINGIKQFFSPGFRMKETVPTRLGVSNNKVTTYD